MHAGTAFFIYRQFNVLKVHLSCFSGKLVPFNDCRRMKVNYTFSDPTAFQFNRGILNFETNPVSFKYAKCTDQPVQCCSPYINVA